MYVLQERQCVSEDAIPFATAKMLIHAQVVPVELLLRDLSAGQIDGPPQHDLPPLSAMGRGGVSLSY